jgi:hypothetical protein
MPLHQMLDRLLQAVERQLEHREDLPDRPNRPGVLPARLTSKNSPLIVQPLENGVLSNIVSGETGLLNLTWRRLRMKKTLLFSLILFFYRCRFLHSGVCPGQIH